MSQKAVTRAALPTAFFSGLLVSFSVSAQTPPDYFVTTGQSGAQTQIDSSHTSSWTLNISPGYTINFGGGNFTMKDGSGTTTDLMLSIYFGAVDPANVVASSSYTQTDFNTLHGGNSTSFSSTLLNLPYAMTAGTYIVTLTSTAPDVQSQAYFIKGASSSLLLSLDGTTSPPAGAVTLSGPAAPTNITSTAPATTSDLSAGLALPVLDGGTLTASPSPSTVSTDLTLSSQGGTFNQNGQNTTYSGVISGPGPATFSNSGTGGSTTLTGTNTYTGATTIDPNATLTLSGGGSIAPSSQVTANGLFNIAPATSPVSITTLAGSGSVALGSNTLTLTNASTTFSGVIGGTGGLTISGGTQTLSGLNTYTGLTTIDPGATLALSGNGSVAGSLLNAGTLDLKSGTGNQIGGNYTQTSSGTLLLQLSSPTTTNPNGTPTVSSTLKVAGDVTLGGTLNYTALLGPGQKYYPGETFDVLDYGGTLTGSFANIVGPSIPGYRLVVDYSKPGDVNLVLLADLTPIKMATAAGPAGSDQTARGPVVQTGLNSIAAAGANTATAVSPLQNNLASFNTIGSLTTKTVTSVSYTSGFGVQQSFSQPTANSDTFTQSATNVLSAVATSSAKVLGSQVAVGSANTAALSTYSGSSGQIVQVVANQLTANTQTLSNTQTASATTGPAQIGASTTTEQTSGSNINIANVLTAPPASGASRTDVGLKQSLGASMLNATATNSATADTLTSGSAGAQNLIQSSSMTANALNAQLDALALSGGQNATSTSNLTFGNSITTTTALGGSNINGNAQVASLGLNTVRSSGSITFGASDTAFGQTFESQGTLSTVPTTLNAQSASSTRGSSVVAGLRDSTAQTSALSMNSVAAAGALSGSLSQSTAPLNIPTLGNTANASSTSASAMLTDFTQSQSQLLNDTTGLGGNSLALTQTVGLPQTLSSANSQLASAGTVATLNNARQVSTLGTNRATLTALGGASSIQQSTMGSSLSANTLVANGAASTIQSSTQAAFTFANVLR